MTTADVRKTWTPNERRSVAAAAARASIALRERDGIDVPQWIRDAAEGRPTTPPAEQPGPSDHAERLSGSCSSSIPRGKRSC